MVAHHTITNERVRVVANINAATNVCLADKSLDRENAFSFSSIAAQYLDLVVFDENYYKQVYDNKLIEYAKTSPGICKSLNENLPAFTAKLQQEYSSISASLGRMRAQENSAIAKNLSTFGSGMAASASPQFSFPPFQYRSEQPATQNYLVNTRGGLIQCRVTNNSYVFCL